jgi:hypothetical protein
MAARQGRSTCNYGVFSIHRRTILAHRMSYELAFGTIPEGMKVCHRCDNPICVNPAHFFLGTQADNLLDMRTKGRAVSAIARPKKRKLPAEAIQAIRENAERHSQRALAHIYSVSQGTICRIRQYQSWLDKEAGAAL